MKQLFLALGLSLILTVSCFALEGDIPQSEVNPDVTTWALDSVRFLVFTQTCEVTYRKGFIEEGTFVSLGKEVTIVFQNMEDLPNTPEDETSTEFTQLIQAINAGNNIKQTIMNAVKIKLGIQ